MEAGADGVRLSAGLAQHAGVGQRVKSQPVQQQAGLAAGTFRLATTVVTMPCHDRTSPNNRMVAVFTGRSVMPSSWSALNRTSQNLPLSKARGKLLIHEIPWRRFWRGRPASATPRQRLANRAQFLNSPHASISLPMYGFLIALSVCNQLAFTIGQEASR